MRRIRSLYFKSIDGKKKKKSSLKTSTAPSDEAVRYRASLQFNYLPWPIGRNDTFLQSGERCNVVIEPLQKVFLSSERKVAEVTANIKTLFDEIGQQELLWWAALQKKKKHFRDVWQLKMWPRWRNRVRSEKSHAGIEMIMRREAGEAQPATTSAPITEENHPTEAYEASTRSIQSFRNVKLAFWDVTAAKRLLRKLQSGDVAKKLLLLGRDCQRWE